MCTCSLLSLVGAGAGLPEESGWWEAAHPFTEVFPVLAASKAPGWLPRTLSHGSVRAPTHLCFSAAWVPLCRAGAETLFSCVTMWVPPYFHPHNEYNYGGYQPKDGLKIKQDNRQQEG